MLKVLHLIDSGGLYGAERVLLSLVEEQIANGLLPMILSAGDPGIVEKDIEAEATRKGLPLISWRMKSGFNLSEARRIFLWARAEGFQLLHSHGYKFNVLMAIWPAFIRKLPLITTLHGYVRAKRFSKAWLYEFADRLILGRMCHIVLVSESMGYQIPRSIKESQKTSVVVNGLNIASVLRASMEPLPSFLKEFISQSSPVVLGVGRLSKEKGFDRLVEAFFELRKSFPEAGLLIIGEGPQRATIESHVAKFGLDRAVLLPGYYQHVPAVMKNADVLCMPSLTEGLPITLLEAMTVGLPVVASDVGEIGHVLGNGKGGRLFHYESPQALAQELADTLNDPDSQQVLAKWAEYRVHQDYSVHSMMERYLAVYQKALT